MCQPARITTQIWGYWLKRNKVCSQLQNPAKYFCLTDTLYKRRLHKIPQKK